MNDLLTKQQTQTGLDLDRFEAFEDCYASHVRHFIKWCKDHGYSSVIDDCVRQYFTELNHSGYRAGTIRIKRSAVKKRIRQLMEHAPIDDQVRLDRVLSNLDNFGETRAPKIASTAIRSEKTISEAERMILVAAASERLSLMLEFLWCTGCRVSEMTGITLADCTGEGETVDIRVVGKGSKERYLTIRKSLFDKIRDFYRGELYLFETQNGRLYDRSYISNQIHKLGKRTLGRSISSHSYRHSFATRKIKATANLKGVSVYLGHSTTAITANMYDHNLLSNDDLLDAEIV